MQLPKLLRVTTSLAILALAFASCSKNDPGTDPDQPSLSDRKALVSFKFNPSENPALSQVCQSRVIGDTYYITLPLDAPLTGLKASFDLSPKAKAYLDGQEIFSGKTPLDCSKLLKIKVTAENNSSTYYYINAQNGIKQIDDLIYDFMEKYSIPGISVSVAHKEKLVYTRGYGYACREEHERMESKHMLRLASCSKPFASMCIMRLLSEGRLSLEDKPFAPGGVLNKLFPNHKAEFENISLRNLLEHSSGINQSQMFDPMFDNNITVPMSNTETIDYVLRNFSVVNTPGTVYSYSNFGYCVLGRVVEAITGKTYEEYLKEAVLDPAGVKNVRVGSTGLANRFADESVYYTQGSGNGYNNNMKRLDSCGGLIASTPDLMKMACSLDGQPGIPDIFTKSILNLMITPSAAYPSYGLGWRLNHRLYPGAAFHSGNLSGSATMWCRNYNETTDCAILCNSRSYLSDSTGSFDDALYVLLSKVLNRSDWPDRDLFPQYQ